MRGYAYWASGMYNDFANEWQWSSNGKSLLWREMSRNDILLIEREIKNQIKSAFFQIISKILIMLLVIAQVMATVSYVSEHCHSPFESKLLINQFKLLHFKKEFIHLRI